MEREVSQILGFRWYALNDKQFKQTPIDLNIPFYYAGFDEADQFVQSNYFNKKLILTIFLFIVYEPYNHPENCQETFVILFNFL